MINKKTIFIMAFSFILGGIAHVIAQSTTFVYTGALQTFKVPCTTSITITAYGGQGGTDIFEQGGNGAKIVGTFSVTPGQTLDIVVGQQGMGSLSGPYYCGSGGGGSFIWDSANPSVPMLIAAGGGGSAYASTAGVGSATQSPTVSVGGGSCAAGGSGGHGGTGGYSGGGGGWLSNGTNGSNAGGGQDPANGAAGGTAGSPGAAGGYGGGGGCAGNDGAGGGGGGYNGGGGGTVSNNWGGGGGGGSYNGGSNQTNTAGANTGNGSVTIAWTVVVIPVTDTAVVINNVPCADSNGEAYAKATGLELSYLWTPSGGTRDTATGLKAGTYTVTVSSPCGGSATSSITITQPVNIITDTAEVVQSVSCNGGSNASATVIVNGVGKPFIYTWTPSGQTTQTATGLSAGTYSVTVLDECGGTASATVLITQPAAMGIVASAYSNVSCYGLNNGSVQSSVSGGAMPYTYMWAPGGANTDTMGQLTAGIYTLTVTDANGCSNSAAVAVTQPNLLTASVSPVTEVACNGAATGVIQSTIAGGTNPYTYSWTGGKTTANANNVRAGSYTLTVIDSNGCMATATTIVTQPTALNIVQNVTVDSGSCTGSAWVVVTGGVYAYTYLWNNGNNTDYIHYACGGKNYCCVVTDGHGCIDSACVDMLDVAGVATVSNTASNITVYPNPTSGQFTVSMQGMSGSWKIEMYNLLGEQVYSGALNNAGANTQVNMGNQPAGVYLYRVLNSADGHLGGEGKVVLQK